MGQWEGADVTAPATLTIRCRLVGELRKFWTDSPSGEGVLLVAPGSRIEQVLERLELPERQLLITGLNGTKVPHDTVLNEGDEVTVVAPMTGGAR